MSKSFTERIEEFLHNVQAAYKESWTSCASCNTIEHVIRGRARCIAGKVEDLLAASLYDILNNRMPDLLVFVDMPLSYEIEECDKSGKRQKDICYPDIIIAQKKDNQINVLYLLEVKINLGWGRHKLAGEESYTDNSGNKANRSISPIEDDIKNEFTALTNTKVWCRPPVSMKSQQDLHELIKNGELLFKVSSDARYDLILCSSKNVPKTVLNKARDRIGDDPDAVCQLYVLSDEELSLKYLGTKKENPANLCSSDVTKWERRVETIIRKVADR